MSDRTDYDGFIASPDGRVDSVAIGLSPSLVFGIPPVPTVVALL